MDANIKKSLEIRKIVKSTKPEFLRQDINKKVKLKRKYIRPKGLQSKLRLQRRGHSKLPSHGYGSPANVKHFSKDGLKPFLVSNISELNTINPETECIIISSKVGMKLRSEIVRSAVEKKIKIDNLKDANKYLALVEEKVKSRKSVKANKKEIRTQKREKKQKAAEKKKPVEETVSDEEKKKAQKEEKDKILTKNN